MFLDILLLVCLDNMRTVIGALLSRFYKFIDKELQTYKEKQQEIGN